MAELYALPSPIHQLFVFSDFSLRLCSIVSRMSEAATCPATMVATATSIFFMGLARLLVTGRTSHDVIGKGSDSHCRDNGSSENDTDTNRSRPRRSPNLAFHDYIPFNVPTEKT